MTSTVNPLIESITTRQFNISAGCSADYGFDSLDDGGRMLLFQIYQDLYLNKKVSRELLVKCFMANRLAELVELKNKYHPCDSYKTFKELGLSIKNPYTDEDDEYDDDEYDDDDEQGPFEILDDKECFNH